MGVHRLLDYDESGLSERFFNTKHGNFKGGSKHSKAQVIADISGISIPSHNVQYMLREVKQPRTLPLTPTPSIKKMNGSVQWSKSLSNELLNGQGERFPSTALALVSPLGSS